MSRFLSIGEAMVELSRAEAGENDLWRLGFAGDTLNTAWYARACLPTDWQVDYLTRLGADPFSARMTEFLTEARIGTGFITRDPVRSIGLYAIELQDGERSFAFWRGQSAARLLAEDGAHLDAAFAAADGIYLSGITLAILPDAGRDALLSRLAQARAQGKLTAFDPNLRPKLWENPDTMRRWLTAAAKGARILMPSFEDDANWFGDSSPLACAKRWQAAGAEEIVVKNGGGTMGCLAEDIYREVKVEMLKPVDTTGAGDSFNGAYLAGRLTGQGCDDALQKGHAVASQVIARFGALVPLHK